MIWNVSFTHSVKSWWFTIVGAVVLCAPLLAAAQEGYRAAYTEEAFNEAGWDYPGGGLVPCDGGPGDACTWSDFVQLFDNVVFWLITFLAVIAVIMFVIVGFKLVTSAGNKEAWETAKKMFTNVFIGIILVLAAWLIVDTALRTLTGKGINDWIPEDDAEVFETEPITGAASTGGSGFNSGYQGTIGRGGGGLGGSETCDGCVSLNAEGVNVANSYRGISGPDRTDLVHPDVAKAALWMQNEGIDRYGVLPFQVTAAFTRGVGHSAGSMHYKGIAIDFDPINGISNYAVEQLAIEAGFSYVLDEGSHVHADMR